MGSFPPLSVSGVSKTFMVNGAPFHALSNIDLELEHNEIVAVIGASGCGKSTLLRCIAGLETPDRGELKISGEAVTRPGQRSAVVFQDHRLLPWLTVRGNVELALEPLDMGASERHARATRYIALVGLSAFADSFPRQLSGGMAQRAAIARALATETGLVLMDEPFGALDSILRARMQEELLKIWRAHQVSILIVTHDIEEALYLADRVVVMHPGPGHVHEVVDIALPRPRERDTAEFSKLRGHLLAALAQDGPEPGGQLASSARGPNEVGPTGAGPNWASPNRDRADQAGSGRTDPLRADHLKTEASN